MAEDATYQGISYREQGANDWILGSSGVLEVYGKLALGGNTPATSAIYGGAGSSSSKVSSSTGDKNFLEFRFENSATSGDNRGIYNRLYLAGVGGGGESLRCFTSVMDVAAGTAHGAHVSLNFNSTGTVTGLGVAGRNTLHIPNGAMGAGGTYAAIQAEIYSDGANSDAGAVTELAFLRFVNDGNAGGIADVDDDAFLFVLSGGAVGAGNVMAIKSAAAVSHTLRVKIHGTTYYLMVSDAQ